MENCNVCGDRFSTLTNEIEEHGTMKRIFDLFSLSSGVVSDLVQATFAGFVFENDNIRLMGGNDKTAVQQTTPPATPASRPSRTTCTSRTTSPAPANVNPEKSVEFRACQCPGQRPGVVINLNTPLGTPRLGALEDDSSIVYAPKCWAKCCMDQRRKKPLPPKLNTKKYAKKFQKCGMDCRRIHKMEMEIESMRCQLNNIMIEFIPQGQMTRYNDLERKVQCLKAMVTDLKSMYCPPSEKFETLDSISGSKERLQKCEYFSEHEKAKATTTVNSSNYAPVNVAPCKIKNSEGDEGVIKKKTSKDEIVRHKPLIKEQYKSIQVKPAAEREVKYVRTVNCDTNSDQPKDVLKAEKKKKKPCRGRSTLAEDNSFCKYCEHLKLPIITKDLCELVASLTHSFRPENIVLTVVLQSKNVYHINVTTLDTRESLGCVLTTKRAMNEAIQESLFEDYLTLYVADTSHTIKKRNR